MTKESNEKTLMITYKHYKNNELYGIAEYCKIQENSIWVDAVIYYHKYNINEKYVRTLSEFDIKFKKLKGVDRVLEIMDENHNTDTSGSGTVHESFDEYGYKD